MLTAVGGLLIYTWALLPDTGLVTQEMALDKWVRVVVIGLPSTALVVLTLACEQAFRKLGQPAKATIDFLGELSYPIYIFHIYVMGAVKRLGALQFSLPVYSAIVFAATLTVAAAVYVLYEKPVRAFLSRHLLHGKGGSKGKGNQHPPRAAMPLAS